MDGARNRRLRILGVVWLVLGVFAFARALLGISQSVIDPSAAADWVDFSLGMLMIGSVHMVNGWALWHRYAIARPLLAVSSFVLLIMYAGSLVAPPEYAGAGRIGHIGSVFPLLVLAASLWLTLSRSGKQAFESYVARESG